MKAILAFRNARIRQLEHKYLDLRIRRARLELSMLEREEPASEERLKESFTNIKHLSSQHLPSTSTSSTSPSLHLQASSTPVVVGHPSLLQDLNFSSP